MKNIFSAFLVKMATVPERGRKSHWVAPSISERGSGAVESDVPVSLACNGHRRQTAVISTGEERKTSGAST